MSLQGAYHNPSSKVLLPWYLVADVTQYETSMSPSDRARGPGQTSDPFRKGLPLLFRNNLTLGGLVTLLGLVFAYNAYLDITAGATAPGDAHSKVRLSHR